WLLRGRFGMHGTSIHDSGEIGTMSPLRAVKVIALYAHDVWITHVDDWIGIGFWFLFSLMLVAAARREGSTDREEAEPVGRLVPFVVAFAVYLATPFRVGTGVLLNVRMAPVLAFFAILGLRPRRGIMTAAPLIAAAGLALVQCVDNVRQ